LQNIPEAPVDLNKRNVTDEIPNEAPPSSSWNTNSFSSSCGPDNSFSIATAYGLDGPGIESWWGRGFPHLSRPVLGPTQPPVQWVTRLSPGGKERPRRDADPFQYHGQERVELYLDSPYGPYGLYRASVPVQGYTLHFVVYIYNLQMLPRASCWVMS